ncbi:MAG: hypothetical protein DHS20C11_16530 [Lysobacteraceae bacterium]|nr:MAG: hypothetical protein DHS20C11_16530 [Xanthomonadaceae bacterium]
MGVSKQQVTDRSEPIFLVYDKQCPACDFYCNLVRIRDDIGELELVDARDDSAIMREITALGLNIDEGMVLKVGSQIYYADEAIYMLSLLGGSSSFFNRFNHWLFSSPKTARWLYPVLKRGRNLLLKIKGVSRINNLNETGMDKF